ncbi:MAG TPA: hypothetical protein VFV80_03065 [Geminicoccaceae bacterium]|nr:hypothetical protein [Geminicoccaceae bacterium]
MDLLASGQSPWRGGRSAKPEAGVAEIQSTAEKTMAVARQSVDVAAAAQQRVAEFVAQRAAANFHELKSVAA